jgi:hypothetical protein
MTRQLPLEIETCVLCGHEGKDVRVALIRWADPGDHDPRPFGYGPRCDDRAGCLDRQREQQVIEA